MPNRSEFSLRTGVFGRVTDPRDPRPGRWLLIEFPWTESARRFGAPIRIYWFGHRRCWTFGARSQAYDWNTSRFTHRWRVFVSYPTNYRDRVTESV